MLLGIAKKNLRSFAEIISPQIGILEYLYLGSYTKMVESTFNSVDLGLWLPWAEEVERSRNI